MGWSEEDEPAGANGALCPAWSLLAPQTEGVVPSGRDNGDGSESREICGDRPREQEVAEKGGLGGKQPPPH